MGLFLVRLLKIFKYMGEYIDFGLQSSILPFSLIISSILVGVLAIFGVNTENDDDDSDGSGGLMQPI